jgi:hypothetical protein
MMDDFTIFRRFLIMALVFMIIMTIFVIVLATEQTTSKQLGEKEIMCYDHYGNEMQGLVCTEEVYGCGWFTTITGECEKQMEDLK